MGSDFFSNDCCHMQARGDLGAGAALLGAVQRGSSAPRSSAPAGQSGGCACLLSYSCMHSLYTLTEEPARAALKCLGRLAESSRLTFGFLL